MRDIMSDNYYLAAGTMHGRGTFIIIRKSDDKTTLRNTGSEAQAYYKQLWKARRLGASYFDRLCALETYED